MYQRIHIGPSTYVRISIATAGLSPVSKTSVFANPKKFPYPFLVMSGNTPRAGTPPGKP